MLLLRIVARIAVALAIAALAGGFLSAIFPLADSLSHFRFHLSLFLALTAGLLMLMKAKRSAAFSVFVSMIGFTMMYPALPNPSSNGQNGISYKFIQFNTLFNNPKIPHAIEMLKRETPDVLALQEVSSNTKTIYDAMVAEMPSHLTCRFAGVGEVAILSKHPKLGERCIDKLGLVWMQVNIDGTPVTMASLHLHWPYPYRQWQQLERLRNEFEAMPRPVMLAGDFNAAPWSETLKRVQRWTDTGIVPGLRLTLRKGFPMVGVIPFLPLDHFLIDPRVTAIDVRSGPQVGSDHLPVILKFRIAPDNSL